MELKSATKGEEALEEESSNSLSGSDADRMKYTQPSAVSSEEEKEEQQEQPGRQLTYPEAPDFLLPEAPEDNRGKHCMCLVILMERIQC